MSADNDTFIWTVAKAIYDSDFDNEPSQEFADRDLDVIGTYLDNAKAAIRAMREPTEAMIDATRFAVPAHSSARDADRALYRAMIDAALGETP